MLRPVGGSGPVDYTQYSKPNPAAKKKKAAKPATKDLPPVVELSPAAQAALKAAQGADATEAAKMGLVAPIEAPADPNALRSSKPPAEESPDVRIQPAKESGGTSGQYDETGQRRDAEKGEKKKKKDDGGAEPKSVDEKA